MKRYQWIAQQLGRKFRLAGMNVAVTYDQVQYGLDRYCKAQAPSGSGIDCGTQLAAVSTPNKLLLKLSFHHMDDHGSYCGWTDHYVRVTPDLEFCFKLTISGKNKRDVKEYLHEVFHHWLDEEVENVAVESHY